MVFPAAPNTIVIPDLEHKTEASFKLKDLSLGWETTAMCNTKMLVSVGRMTARSFQSLTQIQLDALTGGQVSFPIPPDIGNPGDGFAYEHDNDTFFFTQEDTWYETRKELKRRLYKPDMA
jgi:hypothetical protein